MILEERDTATAHWQAALIVTLHDGNEVMQWMSLRESQEEAGILARSRWDDEPLAIKTMTNQRHMMQQQDLVEMRQTGKHFQLRLTPRGVEAYEEIIDNADWGTSDSDTLIRSATENLAPLDLPVRVGKGHKLGRGEWGAMMRALEAGLVDFVIIPRETRTKIGYRS